MAADILLDAAGVTGLEGDPLDEITEEDWNRARHIDVMVGVRSDSRENTHGSG